MKIKKILLLHLLIFFVCLLYALFIKCPVYRLTGKICPFCGMTRAHIAFLKGEFDKAFSFHPLFFLGIPFIMLLAHLSLFKNRVKIIAIIFLCLIGLILGLNYLERIGIIP